MVMSGWRSLKGVTVSRLTRASELIAELGDQGLVHGGLSGKRLGFVSGGFGKEVAHQAGKAAGVFDLRPVAALPEDMELGPGIQSAGSGRSAGG
jgi:hypothetical protein